MAMMRFELYAQLPRFRRRVEEADRLIQAALSKMARPYIAFSTGKDSTVMADLVWSQEPSVPAIYFDADCAFPESTALLSRYEAIGKPIIRWPCEPILDTMERAGGPSSDKCEAETMRSTVYRPIKSLLKRHKFDGVFLGLRDEESPGRASLSRFRGQLFWQKRDGLWECLPMARWTYLDIWAYILKNEIDYCAVYDKLMDLGLAPEDCRLSYWAGETKKRWGRWAILKRGWPELFNRFAARFPEVRSYI